MEDRSGAEAGAAEYLIVGDYACFTEYSHVCRGYILSLKVSEADQGYLNLPYKCKHRQKCQTVPFFQAAFAQQLETLRHAQPHTKGRERYHFHLITDMLLLTKMPAN
jgi:hypothetical protein